MGLSFRQLELFQLLMQTRNVTETARLLNISQPSASQTLKDLETRLGLELFVRRGGRISPSAEARALLPEVERLLLRLDSLENRAAELKDARAGSLTIATIATITGVLLPQALADFRTLRPLVGLKVTALGTHDVIRQIVQETSDLGIIYAPLDDPQIGGEPILTTRMVCLMRPDHRLASKAAVKVDDLANETIIVLDPTAPPGPQLHEHLASAQRRFAGMIEINLTFGAAAMVRQGVGLLIADPMILLSELANGLVMRPFEHVIPVTLVATFSRHRPISRVAVQFIAALRRASAVAVTQLQEKGVPAEAIH
jgi:DNA-binding transcriptional LysR family regulator